MKRNYLIIFPVFAALALCSCSSRFIVEKRRYNPGFYTSFSSDRKHLTDNGKTSKERKQNIDIAGNPDFSVINEEAVKKSISDSAIVNNNEIASVKQDVPALYVINKIRKADKTLQPKKSKSETTKGKSYGEPGKDWMSIIAFVLSLASLLFICLLLASTSVIIEPFINILLTFWPIYSLLAIIFGAVSIRRIKNGLKDKNIDLARFGMITGIVTLSLYILLIAVLILLVFLIPLV